jgi:lipoprotein-releasing system permease protein
MFELFLGVRYLKAKRKQRFISVITIISIMGVMVGVMALVVVLSVMNGFRSDLMKKILGVNSHVLVLNLNGTFSDYRDVARKVSKTPDVLGVTPFVYTQVMVNNSGRVSGAVLRGVDPKSAADVVNFDSMIREGGLASLESEEGGVPSMIIGGELAAQLGASKGSLVTVISPEGKLTPLGRTPNTRRFKISGIFDSGMYEYDASMVYISLKEAQNFLALGDSVTGLEVKVADVYQADRVAKVIKKDLGYPYWTKDWKLMNRSLFSALKLEKLTMFIILTMIVLVGL